MNNAIDIERLYVGQIVNSYDELCNLINDKFKKSTRSRKFQYRNWKYYFDFERIGQKYKIIEIFDDSKPIIDNRGRTSGSRNNNMVYGRYIDPSLCNYFNTVGKRTIHITTNQLAQRVGFINQNYSTAFSNKRQFNKYVSSELGENINYTAVWDVFSSIKSTIKSSIRASLNRIQAQGIINFEETFLIVSANKKEIRVPDDRENEIILDIENKILQELAVKKNKLQMNDRLRNEYYSKMNNALLERLQDFDIIFAGYEINICRHYDKIDELFDNKNTLNKIFVERTKDKLETKKYKIEKDYDFMGSMNPNWKAYIKDRLSDSYLKHGAYVIDILCSLASKNITNEILKQTIEENNIN